MTLVGCDLHTRKQQVAPLDTATGETYERQLLHEGSAVEEFYAALPRPVTVGIESTGYAIWFHALMDRLGRTVLVGDAAKIRAMVVRTVPDRLGGLITAFLRAALCRILCWYLRRNLTTHCNGMVCARPMFIRIFC